MLRDYRPDDAAALNALALAAFAQYQHNYQDWPALSQRIGAMSALADVGEIIVTERDGRLLGGVAYIGPHRPKNEFFRLEWAIMRMLVVSPDARGLGLGRLLAQECIARGRRDQAAVFALHTSDMMNVALPMYLRMGFARQADAPPIHGVAYGIYTKGLARSTEGKLE